MSQNQPSTRATLQSAYYAAEVRVFLSTSPNEIVGVLATRSEFALELPQRDAWTVQVEILKAALTGIDGFLFLEFVVPRLGSRLDAVLIAADTVFAIEFKVGESRYLRHHLNQVWDYALDLKNFHKASHAAPILPMLVATEASESDERLLRPFSDNVYPPCRCNGDGLRKLIDLRIAEKGANALDATEWSRSPYEPTPSIIEAARALYSQHSVDSITRRDAGARNLAVTSGRVEAVIEDSRLKRRKSIIFVTGVPGAGKTLVGLNVATKKRDKQKTTHAVFLSGNGPLVEVLREALARDEEQRLKSARKPARRGESRQRVKAFIQNVHHFRDEGLRSSGPPIDHVVIFDEAQRAWNLRKTANWLAQKKGVLNFSQSEPQFQLSYLDRHADWATVICLVGGGQEIGDGEAGISAWLDAVRDHFPHWHVYVSPELTDTEYAAGKSLELLGNSPSTVRDQALHLSVSMRSFRAENVSKFVKCVLDCEQADAATLFASLGKRYPMALTRDLHLAKEWVRARARGSERFGMVASSSAHRLKPHAIDVRVKIDPVHWFLSDFNDTRSSWYLEDAATEFQVQGLELDWVCVTWDADLRFGPNGWSHNSFKGNKWQKVKSPERQQYLRNAYRVLLTRARQGMVIFVPPGNPNDLTRAPQFYEPTFHYLRDLGIPVL